VFAVPCLSWRSCWPVLCLCPTQQGCGAAAAPGEVRVPWGAWGAVRGGKVLLVVDDCRAALVEIISCWDCVRVAAAVVAVG
jgi:hypothetical protein